MHTIRKVSVSFALVSIPCSLSQAKDDRDVHLTQLHSACHTPIRYQKWCPECERQVDQAEIVRGVKQGESYVLFDEYEIESLNDSASPVIAVESFCDLAEVDPVLFEKAYYLEPAAGVGEKPYALLRQVLVSSGKAVIARMTLRSKEVPCALRVYGDTLVCHVLSWPDEIRQPGDLQNAEVNPRELAMAETLVAAMTEPFDPAKLKDGRRDRIQAEIEKRTPVVPQRDNLSDIHDLLAALEASVKASKPSKRSA